LWNLSNLIHFVFCDVDYVTRSRTTSLYLSLSLDRSASTLHWIAYRNFCHLDMRLLNVLRSRQGRYNLNHYVSLGFECRSNTFLSIFDIWRVQIR